MYICINVYMYICIYVCMYVCIYRARYTTECEPSFYVVTQSVLICSVLDVPRCNKIIGLFCRISSLL